MFFMHLSIHWVYLALLCVLFTGLMPVFMRTALKRMNPLVGAAIFSTILAVILWIILPMMGIPFQFTGLETKAILLLIVDTILLMLTTVFYFISISKADISIAQPLRLLENIALPVIYLFVFKEGIPSKHIFFLVMGLVGILLLIIRRNGAHTEKGWGLYGLLAVAWIMAFHIINRIFAFNLNIYFVLAFAEIVSAVVFWILVLLTRHGSDFKKITIYHGLAMILAGLMAGAAMICLYRSKIAGDVSIVQTLQALAPAITIVMAAALLKEKMDWRVVAGMLLLLASSICLSIF